MCASMIVSNRGDNIWAKSLAMLWVGGDPWAEIIGLKGMSGSWVLGRP